MNERSRKVFEQSYSGDGCNLASTLCKYDLNNLLCVNMTLNNRIVVMDVI